MRTCLWHDTATEIIRRRTPPRFSSASHSWYRNVAFPMEFQCFRKTGVWDPYKEIDLSVSLCCYGFVMSLWWLYDDSVMTCWWFCVVMVLWWVYDDFMMIPWWGHAYRVCLQGLLTWNPAYRTEIIYKLITHLPYMMGAFWKLIL